MAAGGGRARRRVWRVGVDALTLRQERGLIFGCAQTCSEDEPANVTSVRAPSPVMATPPPSCGAHGGQERSLRYAAARPPLRGFCHFLSAEAVSVFPRKAHHGGAAAGEPDVLERDRRPSSCGGASGRVDQQAAT